MIVSVLRLPVRQGCERDVCRFYTEQDVFELAARGGGFRSGRLLAPVEQGAPFLVIAEWDDQASYDRWLAAPARAELSGALGPLLDGDPSGGVYEVVETGAQERDPEASA